MTKHIVTARLDSRRSQFHIIDECLAFYDYNCGEIGDDLSVIAWQKQPAREDV